VPSRPPATTRQTLPARKRPGTAPRLKRSRRALLAAAVAGFLLGTTLAVYYYVQFSAVIDARLGGEIFRNASLVFAAPKPIAVGEALTPEAVAAYLRRALYSEGARGSSVGTYTVERDRVEIRPGPLSFFHDSSPSEGPVTISFRSNHIDSITAAGGSSLDHCRLEPALITTLFDRSRTKRRLVQYQDLPPVLVQAVLAAEDRHFFTHHGVSFYRFIPAALKDLRADERLQGGSTLTMQVARNVVLQNRRRTFRRKIEEILVALLLEQRLSKQQIFQLYANDVYLGQRGSFSINGFGEAADAYFNKDVKSLTLPEAALLAAIIRGPNLYSPYRHPAQALRLRNYVLREMRDDGFITAEEAQRAAQAPLGVAPQNVEGSEAPYFVDMVKDQLLQQFSERDLVSQSYRIYTTLDLDLQRAASDAVAAGMAEVDRALDRQRRAKNAPPRDPRQPQVALVVLDPHTGELRALVGGRDYAASQLNHALARRQPGSSFKPFVYAAALSSAVDGSQPLVTEATLLEDEPSTFEFDGKTYEPRNYKGEYHGPVTLRRALMLSLNSATVHLAEMIGYNKVRDLALAAGINSDIEATPALALGAYVATPLEIAQAYTIFANQGQYLGPKSILEVRDSAGHILYQSEQKSRQVLDPRVAYLMVNLMESVIDHGTGYGVRARGFTLPAAGKTGTSHDGWFAGFTSNLLAVVWVGYDDDRELNLSGSASALPVWTDFMKAATALPDYRNVVPFIEPPGIVTAQVDVPADPVVANDPSGPQPQLFIAGTEPPTGPAILEGARNILSRIFHLGSSPAAPPVARPPAAAARPAPSPRRPPAGAEPAADTAAHPPSPADNGKKKSAIKRFFSIFKHKKLPDEPASPDSKPP
jgi:penicillin-binding protein 1B